ncbi:MAG: GIY-YIG nuclease family protein [Candidatus Rifleibacteriota bacterium]
MKAETSVWYAYILRCSDNTLYTGITNDLQHRIEAHNSGTGAKYTRGRTPVQLVYSEKLSDRSSATIREREIKSLSRDEKLLLIQASNKEA